MSNCIFELDSATYIYPNGQEAVGRVSLNVSQGERLAVLGANASGKSTLLQLLDGLLFCTSGRVAAFGTELTERAIDGTPFGRFFRREVAMLFQNVEAQLFCPSVEDELAFAPRHLGMSEAEISRRVDDLAGMFNLRNIRPRPPQTLSGGEKRRVGLAAILAAGPSVILLDEPTSGLDPRSQAFLVDTLLDLGDAGKTLIVATHDLALARDVTTRAVVLTEDHRFAADGPTHTILDDLSLLAEVNLVHVHPHSHGSTVHAHPHSHAGPHEHEHGRKKSAQ